MKMFWEIIAEQCRPDDRQPLKYWLPYGYMVRKVYRAYRYTSWNGVPLDVPGVRRSLFQRLFRSILPYGLVLGYDQKAMGVCDCKESKPAVKRGLAASATEDVRVESLDVSKRISALESRMVELEDAVMVRLDMIENLVRRRRVQ